MRARRALVLIVAMIPLAAVLVWAAQGPIPSPVAPVAGRSCAATAPATATAWTMLFAGLGDAWLGGDGAASVPVGPARTLWLFGDTVTRLGPTGLPGGSRLLHNSAVLVDGACATVVAAGRDVFPSSPDGSWWWPLSAVAVTDGDAVTVTVFLQQVQRTGWSAWSFRTTGLGTARLAVPREGTVRLVSLTPRPMGAEQVLWGAGSAIVGGTAYVYGTRTTGRPMEFGKELLLARAATPLVTGVGGWSYWDGDGWSPSPTAASVIRPAVGGVSTSLTAWSSSGTWTLVTKADEFLGDRVVALTSTHPAGPFAETTLFRAPSSPGHLSYLPLAHPELSSPGRLVVTLNHNVSDLAQALAEPARYRPSFHDVPSPS